MSHIRGKAIAGLKTRKSFTIFFQEENIAFGKIFKRTLLSFPDSVGLLGTTDIGRLLGLLDFLCQGVRLR